MPNATTSVTIVFSGIVPVPTTIETKSPTLGISSILLDVITIKLLLKGPPLLTVPSLLFKLNELLSETATL